MKSIVSPSAIENVNNPAHVTLLTRIDGKPAGKTYALNDGAVGKTVADHAGRYSAKTITLSGSSDDILDGYRALVESLLPSQSLILGSAPAAGGHPYRILPARQIATDDLRPIGIRVVDGMPSMARLKENFVPSRLLLLDFDPDERMPSAWRDMNESERWDLFVAACPEFAGASRLTVGSGSSRVILPDGSRATAGAGSHTYVVMDRALSSDELDAMRTALSVRLWANDLGFTAESKAGAKLKRTLFDASVWLTGREVFAAPPKTLAPLATAPLAAVRVTGGCATALALPNADDMSRFNERTGARVIQTAHDGAIVSLAIEDRDALRMDTVIVTERGAMTVRAFLKSGAEKMRCQSTFRESASWAGILRRTKHGAILHDVGTGTTYRMGSDPADVPSGFLDACAALAKQHPANAHGYARAILFRQSWRCPVQMGFAALVLNLVNAHPSVDRDDLESLASWLKAKGRQAALSAVTIDEAALPSNVRVHHASDIATVYAGVMDAGDGIHLCKAPHGSGKTQSLLKPIALACSNVVAVAPRVSLVADLSERLKLANYQTCLPGSPDLAICLNSIGNPKHAASIANAAIVLIDEVARVTRECHTPSSTLKKSAAATWDRLIRLIVNADLSVGVDADLSTADVTMLAQSVSDSGRATAQTVHLWIIDEADRDLSGEFIRDEGALIAEMFSAIEAGERVLFVADSAKRVASLASELRGRYPEKRIVAIHSLHGLATTGTEAVKTLLSDIGAGVAGIDVLLMSPAVESGVSLNVAHFTRHFAIYGGVIEPSAFNQMLLRDRTAKRWQIAIAGNGFANFADSMGEALNGLAASQRRVMAVADGETFGQFVPNTAFDLDCCRVISAANGARNRYAADLFYLLDHRGWRITRSAICDEDGTGKTIRTSARAALKNDLSSAICEAPDVSLAEIETIREKYAQTPDESAIVARFDVRDATGITADICNADVEIWNGGKLASQNRLFADLTADAGVTERDRNDVAASVPVSLRSFDAARGEAVRALFAALSIDPITGAGTITAASAMAAFDALKGSDHGAVLTHFGICRFNRQPAYPVRWAGDALAKLGLWLAGSGHDGRTYAIATDPLYGSDGGIRLPGWFAMSQIADRRCRYKDFIEPSAIPTRRCRHKDFIEPSASLEPSAMSAAA